MKGKNLQAQIQKKRVFSPLSYFVLPTLQNVIKHLKRKINQEQTKLYKERHFFTYPF